MGQSLLSAETRFNTTVGTLKLEVSLNDWNFANPALELHVHLFVLPAVTSILEFNDAQDVTTFVLSSEAIMTSTITLIGSCIVDDDTIAPLTFQLIENGSVLDLVLRFPRFNRTVSYDPDFSVTPGGSPVDGTKGTGDDLWALLALLLLPISAIMFTGASILLFYRHFTRRHRLNTVKKTLASVSQTVCVEQRVEASL